MELQRIHEARARVAERLEPIAEQLSEVDRERWVKIFAGGGALVAAGLARRHPFLASLAAIGGGVLLWSGISGRRIGTLVPEAATRGREIDIARSITVMRPRPEVYAEWRAFERFPRFMRHVESVTRTAPGRYRWKANLGGIPAEWDAEVLHDHPDALIEWRSLPDSPVINDGRVRFRDALGHRGTEIHVALRYAPPAGPLGGALGRALRPVFAQEIVEDMRRFKRLIEIGEIPTTEGQPSGRVAIDEASR
jgi:uncharacterized membrane protein